MYWFIAMYEFFIREICIPNHMMYSFPNAWSALENSSSISGLTKSDQEYASVNRIIYLKETLGLTHYHKHDLPRCI